MGSITNAPDEPISRIDSKKMHKSVTNAVEKTAQLKRYDNSYMDVHYTPMATFPPFLMLCAVTGQDP